MNFLLAVGKEEVLASFKKEALLLRNAYSLCRSIVSEEERWYASYFETVRIMILRITGNGKAKMAEISARISELLKQSVRSEGVINLFADANKEFSLSDPAFLEELKKMEEKNVAIELLKNLIKEKVSAYKRTNVVQSEKFSEMFNNALSSYLKGMLTNEEVIQELIKLAQEIKKSEEEGNELGLTTEEKAFYDALTKPQAVRDAYENDELVNLTRELTEQLRKNRTIDWQMKESARADMRKMVKRLLKKYHYPPEEAQNAMEIVLAQCEQWADYSEAS